MIPSPIAFTAPALGNGDGGESLPSATEEEEVYHQLWTGGGVRGLSEGDENVAKDAMSAKLREAFIELFHLPMAQFEHRHISRVSAYSVTQFRRLFMSLAAVNNNSDCLVRMDPFKQLQCYLWAEKLRPLGGGDGAAPATSALFSGLAVDSMCSLALSCSVWKRGRYQRRLTPAYLGSVFNAIVHDKKLLNSSQLLLRNVVHGGDNWREYEWLSDRLKVCEAMILESNFTTTDIDARALFQGGDITTRSVKDSHGRLSSLHLATRDNGDQRVELTRRLTSLEAISVLHHKATNQATPQWIVYPATSTQKQCRTTAINMLLFTGDSLGRQSFRRLLDALRRGTPSPSDEVRVPYGSKFVRTNFRHWPSKAVAKWQDAVLVIYPSYDELHMFESLMPHHNVFYGLPFKRPSNTVNTFFENVVAERRRLRCGENGGIPPASNVATEEEEPLFYIVFLWDAITNRPRTESLAPCLPALPLSEFPLRTTHDYDALKRAADQGMNLFHDPPVPSFRALGIRIPLHVHNSNMWDRVESPTTSDWLTRMSVHCNMTTLSSPLNGAATSLRLPGDWVVGEHPTSDSTHLYRVTTQLKHTPASLTRLRVSPPEPWPMVVNESYKFQPTNWRLMRLETPFIWLRNATALVQQRHHEQQQQRTENSRQHHVFFSQLRLLDMGKIMLASGNMFQTSDMLHEGCVGNYWLSGAALHNVSMRPYLRRLSRRVSEVALSLMQHRVNYPGYDWKFSFHPEVDCGQLGTLMTVNTLLIDIVNNERRRTEGRA
ncbi:Hypothetical protein, putative [Bodo saltans]|uniref:Uncharacterized protein n=1 Tax=Bodo saltans TaxID=75058 RepID=A0A0S4JN46_BODSA|nr:Hypothetical protein, putative [Bodo saltans]|eukprot:CUG91564.1 Hypothetical protein, putative [Bodo saltans]